MAYFSFFILIKNKISRHLCKNQFLCGHYILLLIHAFIKALEGLNILHSVRHYLLTGLVNQVAVKNYGLRWECFEKSFYYCHESFLAVFRSQFIAAQQQKMNIKRERNGFKGLGFYFARHLNWYILTTLLHLKGIYWNFSELDVWIFHGGYFMFDTVGNAWNNICMMYTKYLLWISNEQCLVLLSFSNKKYVWHQKLS